MLNEKRKTHKRILCFSTILFLIVGCVNNEVSEPIDNDTLGLNETMTNYFQQEAIEQQASDTFGVKVIRLAKISHNLPEEGPIQYYYYDLVIAPITKRFPIQLQDVQIEVSGDAFDYFNNRNSLLFPAPDQYIDFIRSTDFPSWESINQLHAYEYRLVYSNLTDAIQKERGFENKDIDKGISEFEVKISFNSTTEVIKFSLNEALEIISDESHPLIELDENIKNLYFNGSTQITFEPFRELKQLTQ